MSEFELQWSVDQLVPHAGRMSLLGQVLGAECESLQAALTISPDDLFFDTQGPGTGVGGWLGIEYMAQAVAAWAGLQSRLSGQAPKIGFLLGSRHYQCSRSAFAAGECLRISVRREFHGNNGLSQFDCRIEIGADTVASAQLTVFGPEDPVQFLRDEKTHE